MFKMMNVARKERKKKFKHFMHMSIAHELLIDDRQRSMKEFKKLKIMPTCWNSTL